MIDHLFPLAYACDLTDLTLVAFNLHATGRTKILSYQADSPNIIIGIGGRLGRRSGSSTSVNIYSDGLSAKGIKKVFVF